MLKDFSTRELVEELERREGVHVNVVNPYKDYDVSVNGPAIVLVVYD